MEQHVMTSWWYFSSWNDWVKKRSYSVRLSKMLKLWSKLANKNVKWKMFLCITNSSTVRQWVQWDRSCCPCWEVVRTEAGTLHASCIYLVISNMMINTMCTHAVHEWCLKYQPSPQLGWEKTILACLEKINCPLYTPRQSCWPNCYGQKHRQNSSESSELWLHHKTSFIYHHLSPKPHQTSPVKKIPKVLWVSWQQPLSW